MTADQYLDAILTLPSLREPRVSANGRWVAWTWANTGPVTAVYVAPTDGTAPPLRLTGFTQDSSLVSWTADSTGVLISQDHDGDERVRLFRVDLASPEMLQPLTEPSPAYFLRGGELHSNGRWLLYGANYDFAHAMPLEATWIYRHDLQTGERFVLAAPQRPGRSVPSLNQQGTAVLYPRKDLHPAGQQIWLVDIEGLSDREIVNAGSDKQVSASWHPDGIRSIVLVETAGYRRIGLYDPRSGTCRWLLDDPTRLLEQVYVPTGSAYAVVLETRDARTYASLLDLESARETTFPALPGELQPLAPAADGRWVGLSVAHGNLQTLCCLLSLDDLHPDRFLSLTRLWEQTQIRPAD